MATLHEKLKLDDHITLIIKQNTCNLSVEFSPISFFSPHRRSILPSHFNA